jgi:predicted aldo/keto reductase-like oxidoreductase
MKRSDNPLSPFNPNWKSPIDWSDIQMSAKHGSISSAVVNKKRADGVDMATVHNLSKKTLTNRIDPRHFHIFQKAISSGKNKRTK